MTINPQAEGKSMFEVLQGSVSSHFTQIESILMQNECIGGQYKLITSAAYANNTPVHAPGFTKVCFSNNGSIITDLDNSYIEANLEYTLRWTGQGIADMKDCRIPDPLATGNDKLYARDKASPLTKYFIGFKQSLEALERYDLYVNANMIYSQPFVGPESTVIMAGLNDTIMDNNPFVYTSFKNASTMDANVCGVYVDLEDVPKDTDFKITIPIKINLHQFLLLSPIRYLPSFAGRWELQLYFGSKNLVICPVNPKSYFNTSLALADFASAIKLTKDQNQAITNVEWQMPLDYVDQKLDSIVHHCITDPGDHSKLLGWANYFTQINMPFPIWSANKADGTDKWTNITLSCVDTVVDPCLMNITQFQLRYEVYQSLMQHYVENPLIIPTNTLSYQRFAHSATSGAGDHISATANLPVENIDSMFILIPENDKQQTCYYQPYLSNVRVGMGEFGLRPQRDMDTFASTNQHNNRRFITYLLDALNLETSQISAMNKDFSNSILPHAIEYSREGDNMKRTITHTAKNRMCKQYDCSHFIIGIPLSQVGFQSGTVSSPNANINFQFDGKVENVPWGDKGKDFKSGGVIAMFLTDCELMIQVAPGSDIPVVKLSAKSIV